MLIALFRDTPQVGCRHATPNARRTLYEPRLRYSCSGLVYVTRWSRFHSRIAELCESLHTNELQIYDVDRFANL